jgi:glycine/D-amino acid oxidase-like deaminating enzyme
MQSLITRRKWLLALGSGAGAALVTRVGFAHAAGEAKPLNERWDTVVIGAGVFGAWTAWNLSRRHQRVLLIDAWGPGNARASSGGESRMTRTAYGPDEVYTRMAFESLSEWRWLSARSGLPIFHPVGVLFFFSGLEPYLTKTLEVHRRLGIPIQQLQKGELVRRFPQFSWDGIELGLYEPELGALMARRAVQTLVKEFVAAGGEYRVAAAAPAAAGMAAPANSGGRLDTLALADGTQVSAGNFVFACGPWLPKLFPAVLGARIFVTRQEVFFFSPPAGDARFQPGAMPGWADFNGGDIYYGFPDLEARGVKVAHDGHGALMDPDEGDREFSGPALEEVRAFMRRRLPALAQRALNEARVCQYENSSNGDFLIDRHPALSNVVLLGAGSGHGFKHGPAVGRYAAQLLLGELQAPEPRFALATKADTQRRAVH